MLQIVTAATTSTSGMVHGGRAIVERVIGIAAQLQELSGRLTTAADGASAAGTPALAEAMTGAIQSWQASLAMVAQSVGAEGANLGGAAEAYTIVDESAIPAG